MSEPILNDSNDTIEEALVKALIRTIFKEIVRQDVINFVMELTTPEKIEMLVMLNYNNN